MGWNIWNYLIKIVFVVVVGQYLCVSVPSALPEDIIKLAKDVKPVTEIQQNGNDFIITSKTPGKTITNSFTIGKEAEITTMDGKKLKVEYVAYNLRLLWCRTVQGELISCAGAQFLERSRYFLNFQLKK